MTPTCASSIGRDFFVATTDRRSELRGLKWDLLRSGPAAGPQLTGTSVYRPFSGGERRTVPVTATAYSLPTRPDPMSAAGKLAAILRHSVMPLRWEPLNHFAQHRGVGSAAAAFPIDIYVVPPLADGLPPLRVSPLDLALLDEGRTGPLPAPASPDALTLVLVGCHAVCIRDYGELSASLLALEAGMIAGQISILAALFGWRTTVSAAPDWEPYRRALGLDHWSDAPILLVTLFGEDVRSALSGLERSQTRSSRPVPFHELADGFPRLRALLEAAAHPLGAAAGESRGAASVDPAAVGRRTRLAERGLGAALANRSSGPGIGTGQSRAVDSALLLPLLADAAAVAAMAGATRSLSVRPCLALSRRGTAEESPQAHRVQLPDFTLAEAPAGTLAGLPPGPFCLFTLGVDDKAALDLHGAYGFIAAHVAAGALAQSICVAATLQGLAARPLRSYRDAEASARLPLEARALLQIQIERPAGPNIAYHLF